MYEIGERLRFSLFGKSHGPCVGCVLYGMPSGFAIDMDMVSAEIMRLSL